MGRKESVKIGENKGIPRIYLEGKWMAKSGFEPGTKIRVDIQSREITVVATEEGDRKVSGKKKGTVPVIDLRCHDIAEAFENIEEVKVVAGENELTISPIRVEALRKQRELAKTEASMFSGGGFLSLAAKQAGFEPKFAIEVDPKYAAIFEANHPGVEMHQMSAHQVEYDEFNKYGPIGLFTAGIPCEPYSQIRTRERGTGKVLESKTAGDHELADMTFWCMDAINRLNPHTVVLEEVPAYLEKDAGKMMIGALKRLYRNVEHKVLKPTDYGCLTGRGRAVIVAQDTPIAWPEQQHNTRTLRDILDPEPHDWFNRETKAWLYEHADKQAAKGNNFMGGVIQTAASTSVPAITKRYFSQQGGNPIVAHPELPDTHRWFTLNEVKRLHGVPDDYFLGAAKTTAGEVIGQGVVVDLFRQVIESVTA